jgi:type IX secretion system PorP/SprF family membrane protein
MLREICLKKVAAIIGFSCLVFSLHAQQQGQYSQYMMNYSLINPAVAGTSDYLDIRLGYRNQWTGFSGAPRNYYLSGHMPLNKVHNKHVKQRDKGDPYHVVGGVFSGQKLGALSHNAGYLTYAFHLPLTSKLTMSMGAVAGFNQFALDVNALNFGDGVTDPAAFGAANKTNFDMGLGIWVYTKNLFVGASSMQVLQSKIDFGNIDGPGVLNRLYYVTGGYKIDVNRDLKVIPTVLFKNTTTAMQFDINTKVRFRDLLWAGVSYRKEDAVLALAGVGIPLGANKGGSGVNGNGHGNNARLEIGYSYDFNTSRLRNYNAGSHEIMIGLILPVGGRLICPSDYW